MKVDFDIFYPSTIHPEIFVCKICGALVQERNFHAEFHNKLNELDMVVKDFMDEWRKKRH